MPESHNDIINPEDPMESVHQEPPVIGLNGSGSGSSNSSSTTSIFSNVFGSSSVAGSLQSQTPAFSDLLCVMARSEQPKTDPPSELTSLGLSTNNGFTLFGTTAIPYVRSQQPDPALSATALLQKAALMGAAASNSSLLCGYGLSGQQQWDQNKNEHHVSKIASGIGLTGDGLAEYMIPSTLFGSELTTLDLLGLGIAGGRTPTSAYSNMVSSVDASFDGPIASSGQDRQDRHSEEIGSTNM